MPARRQTAWTPRGRIGVGEADGSLQGWVGEPAEGVRSCAACARRSAHGAAATRSAWAWALRLRRRGRAPLGRGAGRPRRWHGRPPVTGARRGPTCVRRPLGSALAKDRPAWRHAACRSRRRIAPACGTRTTPRRGGGQGCGPRPFPAGERRRLADWAPHPARWAPRWSRRVGGPPAARPAPGCNRELST